jgi:hypothetical protein
MPTDSKFHGNEPVDSLKAGKFDEWLMIIGFSGTLSSLVSVYCDAGRLRAMSLPNHV